MRPAEVDGFLLARAGQQSVEKARRIAVATADAVDPHSFARPREARVTHVALDLDVDFPHRSVAGSATLDVLRRTGAKRLVLDSKGYRVTKVNDACNTALDMYNRGLERLTKNGQDVSRVGAFRDAWNRNFDINAFRYEDALRRGDREEIDRIAPKGKGNPDLAKRMTVLRALSNTGDMP